MLHFRDPDKDSSHLGTHQNVIEGIFTHNSAWISKNLETLLHTAHGLEPGSQRIRNPRLAKSTMCAPILTVSTIGPHIHPFNLCVALRAVEEHRIRDHRGQEGGKLVVASSGEAG